MPRASSLQVFFCCSSTWLIRRQRGKPHFGPRCIGRFPWTNKHLYGDLQGTQYTSNSMLSRITRKRLEVLSASLPRYSRTFHRPILPRAATPHPTISSTRRQQPNGFRPLLGPQQLRPHLSLFCVGFHSSAPRPDVFFVAFPALKATLLSITRVTLIFLPFVYRYRLWKKWPRMSIALLQIPVSILSSWGRWGPRVTEWGVCRFGPCALWWLLRWIRHLKLNDGDFWWWAIKKNWNGM